MIIIDKLSKKYRNSKFKSLDNVDMKIPSGVFGLIGANGAGKTSLFKTLATLMPIESGSIMIDGIDISERTQEYRKSLGYLPQKFDFFNNLTIYEMLDYIGLLKDIKDGERDLEIKKLISNFNLEDKTNSKLKELSGGQRQRIGIAQALIGNPKVVIFDEPTVGLDPSERLRFRNIINDYIKKQDRTVILSTHIISDISILCENLAIMKAGKVVYCGSIDKLIESIDGKIYTDTLQIDEAIDKKKYENIISIARKKNKVEVRFIADDENINSYEKAVPTIEDAYFYKMFMEA